MALTVSDLLSQVGGTWGAIAIVFAVFNLKNLPFVWHMRIFSAVWRHQYLTPRPTNKQAILFQPVITSTRTPATECDYNMHKSNSTFFSDLDVARLHLMFCLDKMGIDDVRRQITAEGKGSVQFMLGGVACTFKREVKPYESVDVYTRVLSWDRKWLYVVSFIVKSGTRPSSYTLQPWKKGANKKETTPPKKPVVCAIAIAKFVYKQGRMTIPPEVVLQRAGLLPEKPADAAKEESPAKPIPGAATVGELIEPVESEAWTWNIAESERLRGKKVADLMNELDALQDDFAPEATPALGEFFDL